MDSLKQRVQELRRQQAIARMQVLKLEADLEDARQTLWMTMGAVQAFEESLRLVNEGNTCDNRDKEPGDGQVDGGGVEKRAGNGERRPGEPGGNAPADGVGRDD